MDKRDWRLVVRAAEGQLPNVQVATRAEMQAVCGYAVRLLGALAEDYARDCEGAGLRVGRGELATAPDPDELVVPY